MALAARTLTVDTLTTDQNGRVLTARYDSPPLNFMNAAFARDCRRLVSAAGKAPSVEGVVITGSPPDRFVTHFDVDELAGGLGRSRATLSRLHSMIRAMRSGVVYLAAINGPCLGGGLELALACGLRHVGDGEHIRLG
jgi:enoyl-CoA hydratase/carnithine racemase